MRIHLRTQGQCSCVARGWGEVEWGHAEWCGGDVNSFFFFCFGFLRQGFSVAFEPVLELVLVDQAGLELTEICLPLPLKCWD